MVILMIIAEENFDNEGCLLKVVLSIKSVVSLFGGSLRSIAIDPNVSPNEEVAPKIPVCEILSVYKNLTRL